MGYRKSLLLILILLLPLASAQPTILYETEWSSSLGKSLDALTDGGNLYDLGAPEIWPASNLLTVVELTQPGLDHWPQNALQIDGTVDNSALVGVPSSLFWRAPAVGETVYYRFLFYHSVPDGIPSGDHGMQTNGGSISHLWTHYSGSGTFDISFGSYTGGLYTYTVEGVLPKNTPLRFEWALTRLPDAGNGDMQATAQIRIFDESDSMTAPLLTEDDFCAEGRCAQYSSIGDLTSINFGPSIDDAFRRYIFGNSGPGAQNADPANCCVYVTGFAAAISSSANDWIGPYNSVPCTDGDTRTCGSDVGVCTSGTQTCTSGSWGTCVGETPPSTEVCDDTLDNDCDSATDCSDSDCTAAPECTVPPTCGDLSCSGNETCSTCPGDCGACPTCGDSICNGAETCSTCPGDCGTCGSTCGDLTCDAGETCSSCPGDCGTCPPPPTNNPGDVNNDLMVDLADLVMMTLNLGNSGFDPATDINGDGIVNIFDMVVVARNYGNDYTPIIIPGLVAHYDFNEGSGTTVTDLSGNGNDGTINGATWTTGQTDNALNFDGTNDYVEIPHDSTLDITDEITLMAWINASVDGQDSIIAKGSFGSSYAFFLNNGAYEFHLLDFIPPTGQTIATNTWTHVALTFDGNNAIIYENGVEIYSRTESGTIPSNTQVLQIGNIPGVDVYFLGMIDDVRIYNRALSQAEIVTDMNS